MSEIKDGGPAFPNVPDNTADWREWDTGMTLRDYFAAKAMQAFITNNWPVREAGNEAYLTKTAYSVADAMLRARQS